MPEQDYDKVAVCAQCLNFTHLNPEDSPECEICQGQVFTPVRYGDRTAESKPTGHPTLYRTAPLCPRCEQTMKGNPASSSHSRCYPTTMLEEPIPVDA